MEQARWIAVAAFTALASAGGGAMAAEATATAPEQESAATPAEATDPRLPTAQDTHRAGETQSEAGTGDVADVPPTLDEAAAAREDMKASTADRAARNPNPAEEGGKSE